jgi:transcriptional regulator with XRE-family HTH domain
VDQEDNIWYGDRVKSAVTRDVQAVANYLRLCIQAERRTLRSIETELEMGEGYLGQLLRGAVDLKLKHVLGVLDVLGIDPLEFFSAVYEKTDGGVPHRPARLPPEAELGERSRRRPLSPEEVASGVAVTMERFRAALVTMLQQLGEIIEEEKEMEEMEEEAPPAHGRARKRAG